MNGCPYAESWGCPLEAIPDWDAPVELALNRMRAMSFVRLCLEADGVPPPARSLFRYHISREDAVKMIAEVSSGRCE